MATADGNGLWVPLSELARMRGVTKGPLSRRVARIEAQGIALSRPGAGGQKLINVAAFDRATEETTDVVRATNGVGVASELAAPARPDSEALVYAREQARNAAYAADLKKLDLDERLGKLVPVEHVVEAMTTCAAALTRALDDLPAAADEIAAAVARDGAQGARRALKAAVASLRETLAQNMRVLQSAAAVPSDAEDGEPA